MPPPPDAAAGREPDERRRATRVLAVIGAAVVLLYLYLMLSATEAHFVPQVVDLYLVCQYARGIAEGHPFQYNPGDPASTGATSLLHTLLLALAHALGAKGEGLIAFAIVLGAGLYVASILEARRIGAHLAGPREALLAGLLVALGGPVVWGFLYGADVALFMFLGLLVFERVLAGWGSPRPTTGAVAAAGLLALARPEGLPIALALGALWTRHAGPRAADRLVPWVPAVLALGVAGFNRALTGQWLGTSVADKSLLANYGLDQALGLSAAYVVDVVRGLLLGFYPSESRIGFARGWAPFYFPPFALVFVVAVIAAASPLRAAVAAWTGVIFGVFLLSVPNVFMGVHFNRYLMWAFPTLLALTAVGIGVVSRGLAGPDPGRDRSLFRAAAAVAVGLGLLSTVRFGVLYGELAGEVYRRDVAAARWITRNLPPGVPIANLATSVEYLTGHRGLNLHGVTSPAFYGNTRVEREAGTFEALGRLAADERPAYLISSVSMQEGSPVFRELARQPPLFTTTAMTDELLIFGMRYDAADRNRSFYLPAIHDALRGLDEVDRLNVCDTRDEAAHDYAWRSRIGDLRLHGTARVESYRSGAAQGQTVIDAGRPIVGEESFRVRCAPGRDLTVVMRTAADVDAAVLRPEGSLRRTLQFAEAGILVQVDGESAGRWSFRPREGWEEVAFRIPAALVKSERPQLRLAGRYGSFFFWFYQAAG